MPYEGSFTPSSCERCGAPAVPGGPPCPNCGASVGVAMAGAPALYGGGPGSMRSAPAVQAAPAGWLVPVAMTLMAVKVLLYLLLAAGLAAVAWITGVAVTGMLAIAVFLDARQAGADLLPLSRLNLPSVERTSSLSWAAATFLGWFVAVPWYLAVRSSVWRAGAQTRQVGTFPDARTRRRAAKVGRTLPRDAVLANG